MTKPPLTKTLSEKKYQLILASQSPRRQQLMHEMGLEYSIWNNLEIDENFDLSTNPYQLPKLLAQRKAHAYKPLMSKNQILLACDTIVLCDNIPLNKPNNEEEARHMLQSLSGRKHAVITGVCILTHQKEILTEDITYVWFESLINEEIDFYVKTFIPLDKAGAYGIQEWIGLIGIRRIEGSYSNVVGLPTTLIYNQLRILLAQI